MGNAHRRHENRSTSQNIEGAAETETPSRYYELNRTETTNTPVETATLPPPVTEVEIVLPPKPSQATVIPPGCGGSSAISLQRATAAQQTPAEASAGARSGASISLAIPTRELSSSLDSRSSSNWSLAACKFFRSRDRATRKSFTSLQGSRRHRTRWHRPITNSIFSSHFKELSCNEKFHVEHFVAKGAFGEVFKVCNKREADASDSPSYALKVIKKSKLIAENSVQQIKDEAEIQKLCGHHPFIVKQIDLWQNRHNLHILSEYMPNGELFNKIAYFSFDLKRLYVAEIALAIDFLHNAGIIFRDAKPENILLTQQFHIKLTDFGLSKRLKLGASTRTICGTFKYMAPEILCGEPYGHAVDWWALGVIACQMLTQKCPNINRFLQRRCSSGLTDGLSNAPSFAQINGDLMDSDSEEFLPKNTQDLSHGEQDLLRRLLALEPRQRVRSVMSLQRIAFYKDYKLDTKWLLNLSPLDIIARDGIHIYEGNHYKQSSSEVIDKEFPSF